MDKINAEQVKVIDFPGPEKHSDKPRKSGLNRNKEGSVRKVNGNIYVDFMYLGERVRESSGLAWNDNNAKHVREQLDKIIVGIKSGTFKFGKVFPNSKKTDYFVEKEQLVFGLNKTPDQVIFNDHVWNWYNLRKASDGISSQNTWWIQRIYRNCI